jgi:hypothetical protein
MALYTIFAWTAIVIVGGAYYWLYIREAPFPSHLLGLPSKPHSRESTVEGLAVTSPQKRKRKTGAFKRRLATSQTNELFAGTSGLSAEESEDETRRGKSTQQVHDEQVGLAENESLKGNYLDMLSPF